MLDQLHQHLVEGLSGVAGVQYCDYPPKRRDRITIPAIFVDLAELEPTTDPGTGELALIAHWEARIVVSDNQPESVAWGLVQAVMHWLFSYDFPAINVGRASLKQAAPDHFSPEFQGHRVWLVEWTQAVRVGENVWAEAGVIPETILVGEAGDSHTSLEIPDVNGI